MKPIAEVRGVNTRDTGGGINAVCWHNSNLDQQKQDMLQRPGLDGGAGGTRR